MGHSVDYICSVFVKLFRHLTETTDFFLWYHCPCFVCLFLHSPSFCSYWLLFCTQLFSFIAASLSCFPLFLFFFDKRLPWDVGIYHFVSSKCCFSIVQQLFVSNIFLNFIYLFWAGGPERKDLHRNNAVLSSATTSSVAYLSQCPLLQAQAGLWLLQ